MSVGVNVLRHLLDELRLLLGMQMHAEFVGRGRPDESVLSDGLLFVLSKGQRVKGGHIGCVGRVEGAGVLRGVVEPLLVARVLLLAGGEVLGLHGERKLVHRESLVVVFFRGRSGDNA